jgi:Icc protein
MLLAHITDLHIGFEPGNPDEPNAKRLQQVVASLQSLQPAPDGLLITGDLTEYGDADSYARLRQLLAPLAMPWFVAVGNHDVREQMLAAFPETPTNHGFVQYVVDLNGKRLIVLDTRDDQRQGGAFCERRAEWLRTCLAQAPDQPTLIALHHPPLPVGIDWMDPNAHAGWTDRLGKIVSEAPQIVAVVGGHLHRPVTARWAGTVYVGTSSTAPQLALDLLPTNVEPDGRPLIVTEAPAYALHRWSEAGLVSHFATAGDQRAIVRFDSASEQMLTTLRADSAAG